MVLESSRLSRDLCCHSAPFLGCRPKRIKETPVSSLPLWPIYTLLTYKNGPNQSSHL
ncbi:hypothetical protein AG1IA_05943 [Rhizoctonia solani AG-1 IA]|uniref:Uncharacterized protein n=1 Tax=Thanatephorus cucumeris (strain AG1-IA) TaxID=983506 RepID=L8WPE4_THACA|nr:hypothetical protein AG1IA_05943 [Rhizoctonia solani AG-1 IA]